MPFFEGTAQDALGKNSQSLKGESTENSLMRLAFHDCIPYANENDGWACDGCLNWANMATESPSANRPEHVWQWEPVFKTDNKGLDGVVESLEKIYKTIDWPLKEPSLNISLYQAGKSRADLWQLAGLVALDLAIERANRACDLDYHGKQQVLNSYFLLFSNETDQNHIGTDYLVGRP